MSDETIDFVKLKERLIDFARQRDWEKFHTPKNLAMALTVEASELLEIFQWTTPEEAWALVADPVKKVAIEDELADILVYAVRMATVLDLNLKESIENKIDKNAQKYPADLVKGSSKKYNEYKT